MIVPGSSSPLILGALHPKTVAYIAAMTVKPTIRRTRIIDQTIKMMQSCGALDKLGCLYFLAAHDVQAARLNVITAADPMLSVGAPTWIADQGYSDFNSNFIYLPWTQNLIPKVTQNSNHFGWYGLTDSNANAADFGVNINGNPHWASIAYTTASNLGFYSNSNSAGYKYSGLTNVTNSVGSYINSRNTSTDFDIYKNGINVGVGTGSGISGSAASVAMAAGNVVVGGQFSTISGRRISVAHAGAGLTASEVKGLSDAINFYMSNLIIATHPVARSYITAMDVRPSESRQLLIDSTVRQLDSSGVLSKLSCLYLFAGHDANASRLNVINPITAQSAILAGGPTFTVDSGWLSVNTSNFLYTPNLPLFPLVTQNSMHMGQWYTTTATNDTADCSASGAGNVTFSHVGYSATLGAKSNLNNANGAYVNSGTTAVTTSLGHLVSNRVQASDYKIYKNAVDVSNFSSGSLVSVAIPNNYLYIGIQQAGAGGRRIGIMHLGAGLTTTEITSLYNTLNFYMTNL